MPTKVNQDIYKTMKRMSRHKNYKIINFNLSPTDILYHGHFFKVNPKYLSFKKLPMLSKV